LAKDGFVVSDSFARSLRSATTLGQFPESRRIFQRNGDFYRSGEIFRQPDLAATLTRIALKGPDEFYRGETAGLIARTMKEPGWIDAADLAGYRAVVRRPLEGTYRGYRVVTMPPPSSGGIALLEMLNMLEGSDFASAGFSTAKGEHLLIEAMRRAFADRAEFLGDPDFVKIPVKGLIDKGYGRKSFQSVKPDSATSSSQIRAGKPAGYESDETTHFSVVDGDGNAVSNTYTLNFGYGSGVTVSGAGFLMNDEMDDFTSKPGIPNGFGLIQSSKNAIGPKRRPLSSMTPTMVFKDRKLILVLGSPGGPTIITTVLQALLDVIDYKMSIGAAVTAPRIHHQWMPDVVDWEKGALSSAVTAKLTDEGYRFNPGKGESRRSWGDAEAIQIDPVTGLRTGAADPRTEDSGATGF
jgi:gamma-glutamyltranspeptidase/glutathione hydrolase